MDKVVDWLEERPVPARRGVVLAVVLLAAALVTLTAVVAPRAAPVAGAAGGVALFVASYGAWHTLLRDDLARSWDVRARYPVARRRLLVAWAALAWVAVLVFVGPLVPFALAGTVNVWVVCVLVWVARSTKDEIDFARARYEAAQNTGQGTGLVADQTTDQDTGQAGAPDAHGPAAPTRDAGPSSHP